jgi:hypothetical protein
MVHIDKNGQIRNERPFSIGLIIEYIWALFNAFYLFFATFFRTDLDYRGNVKSTKGNWSAAPPPRNTRSYGGGGSNIRTTKDVADCSAPGGA